MGDLERHIAMECDRSPEFKAAYEAEAALLALVRARQTANLTQKDVAEALHVSQPYIAQLRTVAANQAISSSSATPARLGQA